MTATQASRPEPTPRIGRRGLLVAGATASAASLAAIDGLLVTPRRLQTSGLVVGKGSPRRVLRILQVSDLHVHALGTLQRQLLERLHESAADVIVITGDSLDRRRSFATLDTLLAEFPRTPRTFAILGNWEYRCGATPDEMARLYGRHGIELLVNRSVTLDHAGTRVRITGLDDVLYGRPDATGPLQTADPVDHHLVLAHCPVTRDAVRLPPAHAATFVLSGHTHGGQVAPFGLATVLPKGCGRYVAGWYADTSPPMYVSRGIGTSLMPVRIGATPELVRIDWRLGPEDAGA